MKIWIGRTESDLLTYPSSYFNNSITYYGSNKFPNFSYKTSYRTCANYDSEFLKFVLATLKKLSPNADYTLYFYSNSTADKLLSIAPELKKHIAAYNPRELTYWYNNKFYTRFWLSNTVNVPAFTLLSKAECSYQLLRKRFPNSDDFVIQKAHSAGGSGTYKLTAENECRVLGKLSLYEPYLVSPFYQNSISACCHTIIGQHTSLVFPVGRQRISATTDNLSYLGTYFQSETALNSNTPQLRAFIQAITSHLSKTGYRGICGFDFLIYNEIPYLVEINPRYMGSSFIINKALSDEGLPSLFELNEYAFRDDRALETYERSIGRLKIPYECINITYSKYREIPVVPKNATVFWDGWDSKMKAEEGAYLFRFMLKKE